LHELAFSTQPASLRIDTGREQGALVCPAVATSGLKVNQQSCAPALAQAISPVAVRIARGLRGSVSAQAALPWLHVRGRSARCQSEPAPFVMPRPLHSSSRAEFLRHSEPTSFVIPN
jgi:hypothetical protein